MAIQSRQKNILVNGFRFEVRENLFEFLKQAGGDYKARGRDFVYTPDGTEINHEASGMPRADRRYPLPGSAFLDWIWVNAICVNQSNLQEKNAQVTSIRDIYANAAKVVAWLGTAGSP